MLVSSLRWCTIKPFKHARSFGVVIQKRSDNAALTDPLYSCQTKESRCNLPIAGPVLESYAVIRKGVTRDRRNTIKSEAGRIARSYEPYDSLFSQGKGQQQEVYSAYSAPSMLNRQSLRVWQNIRTGFRLRSALPARIPRAARRLPASGRLLREGPSPDGLPPRCPPAVNKR